MLLPKIMEHDAQRRFLTDERQGWQGSSWLFAAGPLLEKYRSRRRIVGSLIALNSIFPITVVIGKIWSAAKWTPELHAQRRPIARVAALNFAPSKARVVRFDAQPRPFDSPPDVRSWPPMPRPAPQPPASRATRPGSPPRTYGPPDLEGRELTISHPMTHLSLRQTEKRCNRPGAVQQQASVFGSGSVWTHEVSPRF
jgi:hypothetical protein